jgi:hypothetical protein
VDLLAIGLGGFKTRHGAYPKAILCHESNGERVKDLLRDLEVHGMPVHTDNGGVLATEVWLSDQDIEKEDNGQ